ncbi:MAG: hypothetical protein A2504_10150 [Bdellovibrionales bacterium RIFOXYD12_FULL_39_22]|nr:MAG: hypothetical protein A2385_17785 [Bdellovibrionales bacterium RIFOXYB1_FULL_39_21]OFZ43971.1 MAG: hypothetical protein A2485_04455 [Bdellovibrionales bacterium RIFOXYC12_FULL_39_17]OFZ48343.1 MAG: hypothetical protein A2404_01870 [Bdellovibrionales bacterium RIFOXYC1_FULL_39_130]OFZ71839.1 MAG: hypothetical protein A2451_12775 [Bdellovibrionales bacterium RIFOXYC2_FULL_39_8]OFZ76648.1 MAG: hypothetical protein A2560_17465 [Bdellovibrionales bacterium RIFOXYD1_FULL_39_84]OFZ94934.1 MAG:
MQNSLKGLVCGLLSLNSLSVLAEANMENVSGLAFEDCQTICEVVAQDNSRASRNICMEIQECQIVEWDELTDSCRWIGEETRRVLVDCY